MELVLFQIQHLYSRKFYDIYNIIINLSFNLMFLPPFSHFFSPAKLIQPMHFMPKGVILMRFFLTQKPLINSDFGVCGPEGVKMSTKTPLTCEAAPSLRHMTGQCCCRRLWIDVPRHCAWSRPALFANLPLCSKLTCHPRRDELDWFRLFFLALKTEIVRADPEET